MNSRQTTIRLATLDDRDEWLRMRTTLWPDCPEIEHIREIAKILKQKTWAAFVIARADGGLGGFVEVAERPITEDNEPGPIAHVEGWYVDPDLRRCGLGRRLIQAAEDWARAQGYSEIRSDTQIDNFGSQRAHEALGFAETNRGIYYRKLLGPCPQPS
jgi:aminoglycoside 6'-N-acetyltransferase I